MRVVYQTLFATALIAGVAGGGYYLLQSPSGEGGNGPPSAPAATVDTVEAREQTIRDLVEATGTLRAREAINVVTETAGRVTAIPFEEGQPVAAGAVLLELDADSERAALEEAEATLTDLEAQLRRARQLRESGDVTEQEVDSLAASAAVARAQVRVAEVRLRERTVTAPFAGVVGLRAVSIGAYLDPQTVVTTLDDSEVLRLAFTVPERQLGRLQPGMPVVGTSAAYPGERFEGQVRRLDSRVQAPSRSLRVESEIDNADGRLKPGMFLRVELELDRRPALVIPEEALILEGTRRYVYRIRDDQAERVDIETGNRERGWVEVAAGLDSGDRVVTLGHQRLRDGASVRVRRAAGADWALEAPAGRNEG